METGSGGSVDVGVVYLPTGSGNSVERLNRRPETGLPRRSASMDLLWKSLSGVAGDSARDT